MASEEDIEALPVALLVVQVVLPVEVLVLPFDWPSFEDIEVLLLLVALLPVALLVALVVLVSLVEVSFEDIVALLALAVLLPVVLLVA